VEGIRVLLEIHHQPAKYDKIKEDKRAFYLKIDLSHV
jgi:hypothetical protein